MATKGDISDLDTLMFGGKPMIPLVSGFGRARVPGTIESTNPGGATRQRRKYHGSVYTAKASFYLRDAFMQDYVKSFFQFNEGKKFICHLSADRPIVEPYVVQVVGEWNDEYVSAIDGKLTVNIEIFPARDIELDEFLNGVYPVAGDEIGNWLLGFKKIVLEMPNA